MAHAARRLPGAAVTAPSVRARLDRITREVATEALPNIAREFGRRPPPEDITASIAGWYASNLNPDTWPPTALAALAVASDDQMRATLTAIMKRLAS